MRELEALLKLARKGGGPAQAAFAKDTVYILADQSEFAFKALSRMTKEITEYHHVQKAKVVCSPTEITHSPLLLKGLELGAVIRQAQE